MCLLFAFRDPSHERAVAAELRRRYPGVHVVASHEVAPEFREYERASTTAADAYLAPVAARYLRALAGAAAEAGLPEPVVMLSSGGVLPVGGGGGASGAAARLRARPAASSARGCSRAGPASRTRSRSTWAAPRRTSACCRAAGRRGCPSARSAACRSGLPTVDVHTVGAGGGSLVRRDAGGALRVGPESAGADPGPRVLRARRRADGDRREPAARPAAGGAAGRARARPRRGRGGARRASTRRRSSRSSNAEMLRALRVVSVERGHDPREFALVAYGGAGPLHACALAEELGMEAVLVPAAAGVLSALGLAAGDERRDRVVSHVRPLGEVDDLPQDGEADLRYRGQSFELTVPLGGDLAERFHRAHEERYGYADRAREVELVAVRTAEVAPGPELRAAGRRTASAHPARPWSSWTARPCGFPPGGWGLGMVPAGS